MSDFQVFLPIAKVDKERRTVSGYASTPTKDGDGEIVTLEAIKAALPGYMEYGNIREMHKLDAVGVALEGNIDAKGLFVTAFIKDDEAWGKCQETDLGNGIMAPPVYKGFSIGGRKMAKTGNKITEIDLTEISIVDRPSNPDCKISLAKSAKTIHEGEGGFLLKVKASRSPEQKALAKMARVVEELAKAGPPAARDGLSLPATPKVKEAAEGKTDDVPADGVETRKAYDGSVPCDKHGKQSCDKCMGKTISGGDPKKPYGDVEYADPGHQADGKARYPVDTEKHIRVAWNYINKSKNAAKYPDGKAASVKSKIVAAWKAKIHKDGPPSEGKETPAESKKAEQSRMLKAMSLLDEPAGEAIHGDEFLVLRKGPIAVTQNQDEVFALKKGMNTAASLSYVFDSIRSAQRSLLMEGKREGGDGKDKALAGRLGTIAKDLAGVIGQKAEHEGGEAIDMTDADDQFLNSFLGEDSKMAALQGDNSGNSGGDPLAKAIMDMVKRAAAPTRAMRMAAASEEVKKSRKACKAAREAIEEVHKLLKTSYLSKAAKKDKGGTKDDEPEFDHADAMEKLQKAYGEVEKARTFGKAAIGQIAKASGRAGQNGQEAGDPEAGFFEVPPGVKDLSMRDMAGASPGGEGNGSMPPMYPTDGGVYPGKAAAGGDLAKFAKNGVVPLEMVELYMQKTRMEGELEAFRNMPAGGRGGRPYAFDVQKAFGGAGHGGGGGFSPSGASPNDLNKALFAGVNTAALNSGDENEHVAASAKVIGNFLTSGHFGKSVFDPAFKGAAGTNR